MKLVEKSCPKCGANLEFNSKDREVKCKYCGKAFEIEREQNINDIFDPSNYQLTEEQKEAIEKGFKITSKIGITMSIVFGIIFVLFFGFIIFNIVKSEKEFNKNREETNKVLNEDEESKEIYSLDKLTDSDKERLLNKGLSEIAVWNSQELTSSKVLGYYLVYDKTFEQYTLVEVFELTYGETTIYNGVKFLDVKDKDGVTYSNTNTMGDLLRKGTGANRKSYYGYDEQREIYDKLDKDDVTITATDGLYKR